jgi:hypothetical protein
MYLGQYIKCPIYLPDFNKFGVSRQTFIKLPSIKFHGNCPVRAALIHVDRWMDMTKIIGMSCQITMFTLQNETN